MKAFKHFFITLIIILSFSIISYEQEPFLITLKPKKLKLKKRNFYIWKVIDKRPNKTKIGDILIGQTWHQVNFSHPFPNHLLDAFNKLAPFNQSFVPLTIVIHNFSLKEVDKFDGQVGSIEIELEIFYPDSLNSIAKIHSKKQKEAVDVTRKHPKLIVELLKDCIHQINRLEITNNENLIKFNPQKELKRGLYRNVTAFLTHNPETDILFNFKKTIFKGKYDRYVVRYIDKKKRIKKLFGFSDGKDFYLAASQYYSMAAYFVKAEFLGEYIYFEDRITDLPAAITFGLLGALGSMEKVGIVLDTKNGELAKLDRDYLAKILKNYPELRKMYNNSNKKLEDKKAVLKKFNQVLAEKNN
jgi:hypothetical protein